MERGVLSGELKNFVYSMLEKVSRTFALNIVRLRGVTKDGVAIGYLLFRMADTFEDTPYLNEKEKIEALKRFSSLFENPKDKNELYSGYKELKYLWKEESPEKKLIEEGEKVFDALYSLPVDYRKTIYPFLKESIDGMAMFQERKLNSSQKIYQLKDIEELEEYCYYVAGVVGKMLTEIFSLRAELRPYKEELKRYEIGFGLGLQFTNILKDFSRDLNRGWCYIPKKVTNKLNLSFEELKQNQNKRRLIKEILPWVISYFNDSISYINLIPLSASDIREFCIIPLVLAYRTVKSLYQGREKLSRKEVKRALFMSKVFVYSNKLLEVDYKVIKYYLV